jgi:hypothetical protein
MPKSINTYVRIPEELRQQVDDFAATMPGRPTSEVLIELISRGLRFGQAEQAGREFIETINKTGNRLIRCQALVREMHRQSEELRNWYKYYLQHRDGDPAKALEALNALPGALGVFLAGKPLPREIEAVAGDEAIL